MANKTPNFITERRGNHINFFYKKNVLITGSAGFIGSNLVRRMLSSGANVRGTLHNSIPQIKNDKINYVQTDLLEPKQCDIVCKDIDYLFMCAANTSGASVIENNPLEHVTPNVIMNTNILESSYKNKVKKFLFVSSTTVYPDTTKPVKESDADSGEKFEKYFCVGWMKRFSEILCEMYATKIKNPMPVIVIRPANAYGPYDKFDWERSHVLPALIRRVVERHNPIQVWGDGMDVKDFIFIDDLLDGILLAMEKINCFCPLNIGSGMAISLRDALNKILSIDNYTDAKIVFDESKPTMIRSRLVDVSLSHEILNFSCKTPFDTGISKTIEWYRSRLPREKN